MNEKRRRVRAEKRRAAQRTAAKAAEGAKGQGKARGQSSQEPSAWVWAPAVNRGETFFFFSRNGEKSFLRMAASTAFRGAVNEWMIFNAAHETWARE
jgi:hypothetical protein